MMKPYAKSRDFSIVVLLVCVWCDVAFGFMSAIRQKASNPSPLKAVQTGTTSFISANNSATATISSVDLTKSILFFSATGMSDNPATAMISGQITNSTTLTFQRASGGVVMDVRWYVAEFESGVSVQRGSTSQTATTNNATITAVDLDKTFVLFSTRAGGANLSSDDMSAASLTSTTNLEFINHQGGPDIHHEWQVVEFDAASVQSGSTTFTDTETSVTETVTSYDSTDSVLFFSNTIDYHQSTNKFGALSFRGEFVNSTRVDFHRDYADTDGSGTIKWFLVEFTNKSRIRNGLASFGTSDTQVDSTILPVHTGRTVAFGGGINRRGGTTNQSTDDHVGYAWVDFEFTNATTLRMERPGHNSLTLEVPYYVIEFEP